VEMSHNWSTAHQDFNSGRMNAFVYSEGNRETMGYYDRSLLPHYWKAADEYVLCDRYFSSVMSESAPNHLHLVAGTAGGLTDNNVPPTLNFPPIFEQLDQTGVSWKVYGFTKWYERFGYVQSRPALRKNFASASEFRVDLNSGSLADVTLILGAPGGSEHPPADPSVGQNSVANDVLNPMGGSRYWGGAAIFVTWDDYGGFFDHVPPPQVDSFGYGFRVPCLIASPFARRGFLDHATNDHTSILRFVENRFGLHALAARDAASNDLIEAFDFSQTPRAYVPV
jgi:phospholipase C